MHSLGKKMLFNILATIFIWGALFLPGRADARVQIPENENCGGEGSAIWYFSVGDAEPVDRDGKLQLSKISTITCAYLPETMKSAGVSYLVSINAFPLNWQDKSAFSVF